MTTSNNNLESIRLEYLSLDKPGSLEQLRPFSSSDKTFTVSLFKGENIPEEKTIIIYPFHITFHYSLQMAITSEFHFDSYLICNSVLHRVFTTLKQKKYNSLNENVDSILFVCLRWLKDYEHYLFPEFYKFPGVDLIVCKYCLKLFGFNKKSNKYEINDDFICSKTCRAHYDHRFLTNEIFELYEASTASLWRLRNSLAKKQFKITTTEIAKLESIIDTINLISKYFLRRLTRINSPLYEKGYSSYDKKDIVKVTETNECNIASTLKRELNDISKRDIPLGEGFGASLVLRNQTKYPDYKKKKLGYKPKNQSY